MPTPDAVAQQQLEFWQSKSLDAPIQHAVTAGAAVKLVEEFKRESPNIHLQVLITGSAHLVGQAIGALGGEELVMGVAPPLTRDN